MKKKRKGFVTLTEMNVHRDALCFMAMGPSVLQRLAVGGWWRLVAVGGGWWLAVSSPWGLSLRAVSLTKKNLGS